MVTSQWIVGAKGNEFAICECILCFCKGTGGYFALYNNQINARALNGQSARGFCAGKPTEKSRVF